MSDDIILFLFGLTFLVIGVILLDSGVSEPRTTEVMPILVGATLLSFGIIILWTAVRNWWKWRKEYRRYRNG